MNNNENYLYEFERIPVYELPEEILNTNIDEILAEITKLYEKTENTTH